MKGLVGFFYSVAGFFICFGCYKLWNYDSGAEITGYGSVNKVVEGDAYNYMINAGHATAYFILALIATVIATGFLVSYFIMQRNNQQYVITHTQTETQVKE